MSERDKQEERSQDQEISSERFREIILDLEISKKREEDQRSLSEALLQGLKALTSSESTDDIFLNLLNSLKEVFDFDLALVLRQQDDQLYETAMSTGGDFRKVIWSPDKFFNRLKGGKPTVLGNVAKVAEWHHKPEKLLNYAKSSLYLPISGNHQHAILVFLKEENNYFNHSHKELAARIIPLANSALVNAEKNDLIKEKSKATQALFNSLPVGVMTINGEGIIDSEYSKICEEILETCEIAGESFYQLILAKTSLSQEEKGLTMSIISTCIEDRELTFQLNQHSLPRELEVMINEESKYFDLTWSCISNELDLVSSIILTIKDTTLIKELEENDRVKSRELEIISQLFSSNKDRLADYLSGLKALIDDLDAMDIAENEHNYRSMFRILHTAKGNARVFELYYLSRAIHEMETLLIESDAKNRAENKSLGINNIRSIFEQYYQSAVKFKILSPGDMSNIVNIELNLNQDDVKGVDDIYRDINEGDHSFDQRVISLVHSVQTSRSQSLPQVLTYTINSLSRVAKKLGKEKPTLSFSGEELRPFNEFDSVFQDIFGHLLRNAIDHGIEAPSERIANGKQDKGFISIHTKQEREAVLILVKDDGKGLDLKKIKEKGVEKGLIHQGEDDLQVVSKLIFTPHFSSRDLSTDISGHGVGLDAVIEILAGVGASISLVLDSREKELEFVGFTLELRFPKKMFYRSILALGDKKGDRVA